MPENNRFRIIRSQRRKHLALRIADDGTLEILSPLNLPEAIIHQLLIKNEAIIHRLQVKSQKRQPDFTEGSRFMFLGKAYTLHLTHRLRIFDGGFFVPHGSKEEIRKSMIALYRELAAAIIRKRLLLWLEITGETPEKIRISGANTRWGSCSSNRTISFSWKLIQCPLETVDYVIVHELSHLKELNHSPAFWQQVEKFIPDYRKRKQQLKEFSLQLPHWN